MNITASSNDPAIAGSLLTLNCFTMSNHVPDLMWVSPNGSTIADNGIAVSKQVNCTLKSATLVFDALRTSHAGNYTCISVIADNFHTFQAHHFVNVESKPQVLM